MKRTNRSKEAVAGDAGKIANGVKDIHTLPVDAFGIVWIVNAETPSLAWIINAASGLMNWDVLAAAKRKKDTVTALHERVDSWYRLKAQREKNARLPKEEQQDPHLFEGPDDPDSAKWDSSEMQMAQIAEKDLRHGLEVNYWLHRALLISPEILLKTTFKGLRVIHTLPRVYEHAPERITTTIWADAQRDYQNIMADAYRINSQQEAPNQGDWLTVGKAAERAANSLDCDAKKLKSEISRDCKAGKIECVGERSKRRIKPESLESWISLRKATLKAKENKAEAETALNEVKSLSEENRKLRSRQRN